jgi:hypothetical protein
MTQTLSLSQVRPPRPRPFSSLTPSLPAIYSFYHSCVFRDENNRAIPENRGRVVSQVAGTSRREEKKGKKVPFFLVLKIKIN